MDLVSLVDWHAMILPGQDPRGRGMKQLPLVTRGVSERADPGPSSHHHYPWLLPGNHITATLLPRDSLMFN